MAVTCLVLVAFVIVHMAGNLQVFLGPAKMNGYSAFLKSTGELLWLVRLGLLTALVLHVLMAWQLTRVAAAARPHDYAPREAGASTGASRTMPAGSTRPLAFIEFHALQFT